MQTTATPLPKRHGQEGSPHCPKLTLGPKSAPVLPAEPRIGRLKHQRGCILNVERLDGLQHPLS